ncbi:exocyst complex component EXO70B1-like [Oryza brachyantha]|uniref:exocyst complex component EXO70B1-like n=1 Tax=Oryza brachyantha TaxID=4533 RepID=UPI001AD980C2|nr:exocyst complex component EXO70B1-like [Oryza brachyantha]
MPLRRRDTDSRSQAPHKSSSFSPASARDDGIRQREAIDRNLSLGAARQGDHHELRRDLHPVPAGAAIKEEGEEEERDGAAGDGAPEGGGAEGAGSGEPDLAALSVEIDAFIAGREGGEAVSETALERFASAVEMEIAQSESAADRWATDANGEPRALLAAISRIAALAASLAKIPEGSGGKHTAGAHRVTAVLHRAMAFLEDEFLALLDGPRVPKATNAGDCCKTMKRPPSFEQAQHDSDRCVLPIAADAGAGIGETAPPYPPETVDRLRSMADAMVTAGYVTECTQMFLVARRNAFDALLRALGYEKASIDDVVKMTWEALEAEIVAWTKAFRHTINVGLSTEHDLCGRVFAGRHAAVGRGIFADLSRCVMLHMLNFTEAVAMTKRATEKLFKVLDMYEAIRDASPVIDAFLSAEPADDGRNSTALTDLKAELNSVRSRLGETAAAIFRELENSIRADAGKQPVPGGAVHPLTRYVMNYLKYACEYNSTLEQVFREHGNHSDGGDADGHGGSPFAAQLMEVMELLHGNLEGKSRLYKDPSLSNIFLMNNGRYMLQKIRGSPETNAMLGEAWARKQSTNLRQYHKNYQRETWSRVLGLLRDDGVITVKGSVQKPVLKERFKQFNAAMDEIHRTQGAWVVSDEQLQSELRVSIAAVVVPAYRSFLGRFSQTFSAGRQTEKYVKLSADDVETIIDELFDGNAASMTRRRT